MARLCTLSLTVDAATVDELRVKLEKSLETGELYEHFDIEAGGDAPAAGEAIDQEGEEAFPEDDDPDLSGIDDPTFGEE